MREPFKARALRLAWLLSGRKPRVDQFLSGFLRYRKYLPECDAAEVIPRFAETEVRITQCPVGAWSTPLIDVFIVIKAALGFESKRILELGSYRGDTAKLLAENTPENVTICAVDIDEQHGAAYRGTQAARKIIRRTGPISTSLFPRGEKYDLIFVDANHDFESVMNDTKVAFEVVSSSGVILWHDYFHDGYFHGMCGVPEALANFSRQHSIYAIRGTRLGIYSNVRGWETATLANRMTNRTSTSVWEERQVRG